MNSEALTLIGVLVSVLVTIIGWLYTSAVQKRILDGQINAQNELAQLKNRFDAQQDKLRQLNPTRFADLDTIRSWVQKGLEIETDAYNLRQNFDRALMVKAEALVPITDAWSREIDLYLPIAKQLDRGQPQFLVETSDGNFYCSLADVLDEYRTIVAGSINESLRTFHSLFDRKFDLNEYFAYVEHEISSYGSEISHGSVQRFHQKVITSIEQVRERLATTLLHLL